MAHPAILRYPDGRVPHINLKEGDVAGYVLLPGSLERAKMASSMFHEVVEKGIHREFLTYTGKYKGVDVTVMSTGMGCFSAVTAVEELAAIGAHTFIRIGSCATLQRRIELGNLIIATGCIRDEGSTLEYAPLSFPAIPNLDVLLALIDSVKEAGITYHTGIVRTCDNFYMRNRSPQLNKEYTRLGAVGIDMELSGILVVAMDLGKRAAGILAVGSNLVTGENRYKGQRVDDFEGGEKNMIGVALEAIVKLDAQK